MKNRRNKKWKKAIKVLGIAPLLVGPILTTMACKDQIQESTKDESLEVKNIEPNYEANVKLDQENFAQYTSFDSETKTLTIYEGVTSIANDALESFRDEYNYVDIDAIFSLVLPNSLEEINTAFSQFKIRKLELGVSTRVIHDRAFEESLFTSLELPKTLEEIGDFAFRNSHLKDLSIPSDVTLIGVKAFESSSITTLTFEGSVNNFENNHGMVKPRAFKNASINSIIDQTWRDFNQDRFQVAYSDCVILDTAEQLDSLMEFDEKTKNITIQEGVKVIGSNFSTAFYNSHYYDGASIHLIIPKSVEVIEDYAFADIVIKSLEGGENIKMFGKQAFDKNLISNLNLSKEIVYVGESAFDFNEIANINIGGTIEDFRSRKAKFEMFSFGKTDPKNFHGEDDWLRFLSDTTPKSFKLKTIDVRNWKENADFNEETQTLTIHEGVQVIESISHDDEGLRKKVKHLILPDSLLKIENNGVAYFNLTSVKFNDNLKIIGSNAFGSSQISDLNLPDSVTEIGSLAFIRNPLNSLHLPSYLKEIGKNAFSETGLTQLHLPKSLEVIGEYTFSEANLTNLEIPKYVRRIGESAFKYSHIKEVNFLMSASEFLNRHGVIENSAFEGSDPSSFKGEGWNNDFVNDHFKSAFE